MPNGRVVPTVASASAPAPVVSVTVSSEKPQHSSPTPNIHAVSSVASAPAPTESVAMSDKPRNSLPSPTLCLPADGTSPSSHPILPVPSDQQIATAAITAAHAPEIESITQSFILISGHDDDQEPVTPSIEPVADPTEGM